MTTSNFKGIVVCKDKATYNAIANKDPNKLYVIEGEDLLKIYHSLGQNTDGAIDQQVVTNALNTKAGTAVATTSANGLMAAEDKQKVHDHTNKATLDSIGGTATATTLGVDTVVTSGSSNLITSGAVYNVLGDIEATLRVIRGV